MKYFKLLFSVIALSTILVIASEDANNTYDDINVTDVNLSELIIDNGAGVINNQHTEQP